MTEQEMEGEKYVKEWLANKGIDPKKVVNNSLTFLTGIYNGLVIANSMWRLLDPVFAQNIDKDASVLISYINFRKRRIRGSLDKGMEDASAVPIQGPQVPPADPMKPINPNA